MNIIELELGIELMLFSIPSFLKLPLVVIPAKAGIQLIEKFSRSGLMLVLSPCAERTMVF